jgi:ketosteroid isomerase-like protein
MAVNVNGLLAFVFIATVWLAPCNNSIGKALAEESGPLGVQGLSNDEVDAIRQTMLSWTDALVEGDLALWDTYWAKDSVLMPPDHGRVVGKPKRDALAENASLRRHQEGNIFGLGYRWPRDLAVVSNNIEIEPKSGGTPTVFKQLIVMRQQGNGKWLVQAVMFNSLISSD